MCGRFAISNPRFSRIEATLGTTFPEVRPRYNIAPSQTIPVIRGSADARHEMVEMRWGLIPYWSTEPEISYSTFNARAETLADKPAFREPFRSRRCLIPASGFYEWKTEAGRKQPYYLTEVDDGGLAFAGLWDEWRGPDDSLLSCTIVVGRPNELVAEIHDRMVVILPEDAYATWLNPRTNLDTVRSVMEPYPAARMRAWRVARAVGNAHNEGADLVEPL